MQLFSSKRTMVLGMALSVLALGVQTSHAQDAAQSASSAAPVSADPATTAPADPAPVAPAEAAPVAAPAPVAAAPAVAQLNPIGAPPAGMGQIVFFRPSRFVGMAVSFSVREGDKGVGKLTNGTYFVLPAEPGIKEYNISFEARDTLRLEVEEGETYYVIQSVAMGLIAARPNLTPSSEAAFQEKKLKLTTATATDRH